MQTSLSSYLVRPRITNLRRRWLRRLQSGISTYTSAHPRLTPQTLLIFAAWTVLCGNLAQMLAGSSPAPATAQAALSDTTSITLPASPGKTPVHPPASASQPRSLAGGPTGQLLPPGVISPAGAFFNTYAKGQCTWYVASRRRVPANWGNANRWYYNALASGWRVGPTPSVGAIAWTSTGAYGHVALVESISADHKRVYLAEMNYNGVGVVSHRWTAATNFRYIY